MCFFSVGVYKNGRVEIIANDQGNRITPSYVAFTNDGERLIGDAAKNQLTTNPENTVFDAKRLIGREWSDPTVQHDVKFFPFPVIEKNNKPHIKVETSQGEKVFAPEEISAMVLGKMKEGDCRGLSRQKGHSRGSYCTGLFQWRTKTGEIYDKFDALVLSLNTLLLSKKKKLYALSSKV